MNTDERSSVNPMQIHANLGSKRLEEAAVRSGLSDIDENPVLSHSNANTMHADNSSGSGKHVIVEHQPKRRVSIISDPISEGRNPSSVYSISGYENPAYEQNPLRKISQNSMHKDITPIRKKSILINNGHDLEPGALYDYDSHSNKLSAMNAFHANIQHQQSEFEDDDDNNLEESWLYSFCLKCRGKQHIESWQPPFWQKLCPYPLCPSFRQCARIFVLILIGFLLWITSFIIIGKSAEPGGQLFSLVILAVASNFGGYLISLTTLPRLIGMLAVGILFQNLGWTYLDDDFSEVTSHLRKFALTIILIRAGLEMEPEAFKRVYKTILKLGIIPWILECCTVAVTTHFLLDLPWMWAFLLGSIIAAVSPAVVVPCLFRLRTKGYGVAKGIPTLIIAVSGIDDALSVAIFGIISSMMFSEHGLAYQISQAPVCILGGLIFGVAWGYMARYFPEKADPFVVPLRTIMLFAGGLVTIYGSEEIEYEGAGPLAVVFAAFTSNLFWCKQGWEIEDNPVATAFEIFWMIFEPILFGLTGATIKIDELDSDIVSVGVACIAIGAILRIICTAGIAFGDRLNVKEKFFVALSWMSKATVQAALGPVAMKHLGSNATLKEQHYAYVVQTLCVLSIILTAPLGALLISISGTKLLTKTKQPQITEGWRRSHRPSMRDISIIDEEEEQDDRKVADSVN